jgi:15-cis-phytoene synthase
MTVSPECLPKNEDLTLSAAFIADEGKRVDVLLLHAFLETLREIPLKAKEPLMGEIRLKWWYEAVEEIMADAKVRYHPITEALQDLKTRRGLDLTPLLSMIEAQGALLDKPLTLAGVLEAVDGGESLIAQLSARIIDDEADASGLSAPVRLYGLSLFLGGEGLPRASLPEDVVNTARDAARLSMKSVPTTLMPIVAHAGMAKTYITGRTPGPLKRRFSVLGCFLTGQL